MVYDITVSFLCVVPLLHNAHFNMSVCMLGENSNYGYVILLHLPLVLLFFTYSEVICWTFESHACQREIFNVLCGVRVWREVFQTFSAYHHRAEVGIDQGVHDLTAVVSLPASDPPPSTSDCCSDPSGEP